jgi:hypothetical protein
MKPEMIVMLTHNDETVKNAYQLFDALKNCPISHWGFKDIGLHPEETKKLVRFMKDCGKTTYLEVVSLSEVEGLAGAELAVEAGFDILMGTVFFDSIMDYLKDKAVKYYPFPGHVYGHPSILGGTIDEIVQHAQSLEKKGVAGLDLLTYRFQGDADRLLAEVVAWTNIPIVSAGSIATFERIAQVWNSNAWGFTIGSAFFDAKFVAGGTLEENIMAVCDWLEATHEEDLPKYKAVES